MPKAIVIIQCRTSSSRLPAKAFMPLQGMPSVILCVKRAMNRGANVRVATSDQRSDDVLADLLLEHHVPIFRGPLNDVLKRYVMASEDMDPMDYIVRLTADNMLPDGDFIQTMLDEMLKHNWDYASIDPKSSHLPYGLVAEVFRVSLLREADRKATHSSDREHVTPWIKRHTTCHHVSYPIKQNMSHLRCTLDTIADYRNIQDLFKTVSNPVDISWEALTDLLWENTLQLTENALPEMVLGTVQIGLPYGITNQTGLPSDNESAALIDCALAHGVQIFDTARGYGCAEDRLGHYLAGNNDATIITKLDHAILENQEQTYYDQAVQTSLMASCHALNRQQLDMVMCHRFWQYQSKPIMHAMLDAKNNNLISGIGVSVSTLEEALKAAEDPHITAIQMPFNILDHRWLDIPFQQMLSVRPDLKIYTRSTYLQGLLVGPETSWPDKFKDIAKTVLPFLEKMAKQLKRESIRDLCFNYVRSQAFIQHIVIGCLSEAQLKENIALQKLPLLTQDECEFVLNSAPKYSEQFLNPALW